jgi:hypothetical protein
MLCMGDQWGVFAILSQHGKGDEKFGDDLV